MAFSLATILSVLSAAYVSFSLYQIWSIFVVPPCEPGQVCLDYYLKTNPELELTVFTCIREHPHYDRDLNYLGRVRNFNYSEEMEKNLKVPLPLETQRNGSLYLHVYLLPKGTSKTKYSLFNKHVLSGFIYPLTKYSVPTVSAFDLLSGGKTRENINRAVTHVKKEVHFKMVTGIDELPIQILSADLHGIVRLQGQKTLLPLMQYDSCKDQLNNLVLLENQTTIEVALKYSPVGLGKFRFMVLSDRSFEASKYYGLNDKDLDQLKGLLSDGNKIYLLCITVVIAGLHLVLDILALKNEVTFWRTRTTLAGLSKTTVLWRAFSQFVVFLFLYEELASMLVTVPALFNLLIELWKVMKVLRFNWGKSKNSALSEAEKRSDSIDSTGMRYLLYILFPLCIAGAIYSLIYDHHKSWYSWILNSLVNGVYAFGFLFMLPQLFLNYKMKSVAQLPWRSFMYKAFNTFVDDVFAFIIETPTAHRLACFRDDLVFLVYLYQRWLYPVDKNRIDHNVSFDETPDVIKQSTASRAKKQN